MHFLRSITKFIRTRYPLYPFICIGILGLLSLSWFGTSQYLGNGDFNVRFDREKYFQILWYVWDATISYGVSAPTQVAQLIPYGLLAEISQLINLSSPIFERFTFYYWFTAGGIFTYLLLREFRVQYFPALVGAIFYMINPFSALVIWHLPHGRIQEPYSYAPLVLFIFVKLLNKKEVGLKTYILYTFLWLLASTCYSGPNYLLLHLLIVSIYIFFSIIFSLKKREYEKIKMILFRSTIITTLFFSLSAFWIVPFMSEKQQMVESSQLESIVSNDSAIKLSSVKILDSIRLIGARGITQEYKGDNFYSWRDIFENSVFQIALSIIPILTIMGIFFNQGKYVYFAITLYLASILLTKGMLNPFSWINSFIYEKIGFISSGFRSPFLKFGIPLSLSVSLLIAFSVHSFTLKIKTFYFRFAFFLSLGILLILLATPFINGKVIYYGGQVIKSFRFNLPKEYADLSLFFRRDEEDTGRILNVPISKTNKTHVNWYNGSNFDKWFSGDHPVINSDTGGYSSALTKIYGQELERYNPDYKSKLNYSVLFSMMNAKYLLYHKDTNWDYIKDHSWFYNTTKDKTETFLSNITPLIKSASIENKYYSLYNINTFEDNLFYIPNRTILFDSSTNNLNAFFSQTWITAKDAVINKETENEINKFPADIYMSTLESRDLTETQLGSVAFSLKTIPNQIVDYEIKLQFDNQFPTYTYFVNLSRDRNNLQRANFSPVPYVVSLGDEKTDISPEQFSVDLPEKIFSKIAVNSDSYAISENAERLDPIPLQRAGVLTFYNTMGSDNIINTTSSEESAEVIDASESFPGNPIFNIGNDYDSELNKKVLRLESKNHILGYKIKLETPPTKKVELQVSTKNIKGKSPTFSIVRRRQGGEAKFENYSVKKTLANNWATTTILISDTQDESLFLYLYTEPDKDGSRESINLFSDITVLSVSDDYFEVNLDNIRGQEIAKVIQMKSSNPLIYGQLELKTEQILTDSDFEEKINASNIVNATKTLPGKPSISIYQNSHDSIAGKSSIAIETKNHTAAYKKQHKLSRNECGNFLLGLKYKNEFSSNPQVLITTQGSKNNTKYQRTLKLSEKEWKSYSDIFFVPCDANLLNIYFYAEKTGSQTAKNLFDDINISIVPALPTITAKSFFSSSNAEKNNYKISYSRKSPVYYKIMVKNARSPYPIVFSEGHHQGWILSLNKKAIGNHQRINGYANGWFVEPEVLCADGNTACTRNPDGSYDMEMTVEFFPQRWFYLGLLISGTTLVGCVGYLVYDFAKRRKNRKKKDSFPAIPATNMIDYPRTEPIAHDTPKPTPPTSLHTPQVVIKRPPRRKV